MGKIIRTVKFCSFFSGALIFSVFPSVCFGALVPDKANVDSKMEQGISPQELLKKNQSAIDKMDAKNEQLQLADSDPDQAHLFQIGVTLSEVQTQIQNLEKQLSDLNDQKNSLESELSQTQKVSQGLQAELSELHTQRDSLKSHLPNLSLLETVYTQSVNQRKAIENRILSKYGRRSNLAPDKLFEIFGGSSYQQAKKNEAGAKTAFNQAKLTTSLLETQIQSLDSKIQTIEGNLTPHAKKAQSLQSQIYEIQSKKSQDEKKLLNLNAQKKSLEAELEAANKKPPKKVAPSPAPPAPPAPPIVSPPAPPPVVVAPPPASPPSVHVFPLNLPENRPGMIVVPPQAGQDSRITMFEFTGFQWGVGPRPQVRVYKESFSNGSFVLEIYDLVSLGGHLAFINTRVIVNGGQVSNNGGLTSAASNHPMAGVVRDALQRTTDPNLRAGISVILNHLTIGF